MEKFIQDYAPFSDSFPIWAWLLIGYLLLHLLIRPYLDAIVRRYEHYFDRLAEKTPSLFLRLLIEMLRISFIIVHASHLIAFCITSRDRKLRTWRKNYVIFYIWILSSQFPSWKYYSRVRRWFEATVYYDSRTSYSRPEPLKEEIAYLDRMHELDLDVSHKDFINNYMLKPNKMIVSIPNSFHKMEPNEWLGKNIYRLYFTGYNIFRLLFVYSIYKLLTGSGIFLLVAIGIRILYYLDKLILVKIIVKKAQNDENFYYEAIKNKVIYLHRESEDVKEI